MLLIRGGRFTVVTMIRRIALSALLASSAVAQSASLQERLDQYTGQARQTPGIAVALITPDGVTIATSGLAAPGRNKEPDALFEIGSVTKVFTGILLAELSAEGMVAIDSTVGELMPGDYELDPAVASITLGELATHTAGLPRLPMTADMLWRVFFRRSDPYAGIETNHIFEAVADMTAEDLTARGESSYSNLGPALLGRLLESAAGQTYETLLADRVLTPLGLDQTAFVDAVVDDPRLARPHRGNLRPARNWRFDAYNPAGGLVSDLNDMTTFLQAAMTPAADSALAISLEEYWSDDEGRAASGLGWAIHRNDDEGMIWHNGRTGGYYAFIGFLPEQGRGLVMLSNASHAGNAFAVNLLRGEDHVPRPERDWFFLAFTLFFVAFAPLLAYGYRAQALASLAGTAKTPAGRVNGLSTTIDTAFVLALTWTLGVWNLLPIGYWWAGLFATVILLAASLPPASQLPWLPALPRWRLVLRFISMALTLLLLFWVVCCM